MNIVLTGYRCSGKTAVGKVLAMKLKRAFLDTDHLIEASAAQTIENIVARQGWERFREIEKHVVMEVSRKDGLVIATGGGVVLDGENIKVLQEKGWIVWLMASERIIKERMDSDHALGKKRPSLTGIDSVNEIREVLKCRTAVYEKASNFKVDTSHLSVDEAVSLIISGFSCINI